VVTLRHRCDLQEGIVVYSSTSSFGRRVRCGNLKSAYLILFYTTLNLEVFVFSSLSLLA